MRYEVTMPDLGLGATPLTLSLWLVEVGEELFEGDRLAEVLAGDVTVDIPAPVAGFLREMHVAEDERVSVGQKLGVIEVKDEG
jgi:pyruvate/2-oxoglutarate dehydrogenase complex dihydrolipoamide acyltransferase (E2) component